MFQSVIEYLPPEVMKMIMMAASLIMMIIVTLVLDYLLKLRRLLIERIGKERYDKLYEIAKGIYFYVEQETKNSDLNNQKKGMFDSIFRESIRDISEKELNYIRESVVGEMNKDK